jgi:hypothetical protein
LGPRPKSDVKSRLGKPIFEPIFDRNRLGPTNPRKRKREEEERNVTPQRMENPWDVYDRTSPWYPWIPGMEPRMMEWNRYHKQWISNLMRCEVAPPVYPVYQERYQDEDEDYQSDLSEDRNHQ